MKTNSSKSIISIKRPGVAARPLICSLAGAMMALTGCVADSEPFAPTDDDHAAAIEVAKLHIANGSTVSFMASDELGEAGCSELVPADGKTRALVGASDEVNCLELYLQLTDVATPVPEMLATVFADATNDSLVAQRTIVPHGDSYLELAVEMPDVLKGTGTRITYPHSCPSSDAHWLAVHCDFSGGSSVINNCQTGGWLDYKWHTGSGKRKNSFSETLSCGALTDVRHERKNALGNWTTVYKTESIPFGYFNWMSWKGTFKFKRRVHMFTINHTGWLRPHAIFYND